MPQDTHVFFAPAKEKSGLVTLQTPEGTSLSVHYMGSAHQDENSMPPDHGNLWSI